MRWEGVSLVCGILCVRVCACVCVCVYFAFFDQFSGSHFLAGGLLERKKVIGIWIRKGYGFGKGKGGVSFLEGSKRAGNTSRDDNV